VFSSEGAPLRVLIFNCKLRFNINSYELVSVITIVLTQAILIRSFSVYLFDYSDSISLSLNHFQVLAVMADYIFSGI